MRSPSWPSRIAVADRRAFAALASALALLAACGSPTTASVDDDAPAETATQSSGTPDAVRPEGFDRVVVSVSTGADEEPIETTLWFAGTEDQRRRGLMGVTDLGDADGMLFAFESEAERQFYMWQTPLPLDIFFFDAGGRLVGDAAMTPCLEETSTGCERYSPGVPFLMAIEVPASTARRWTVDAGTVIEIESVLCAAPESACDSGAAPATCCPPPPQ